jgi:hypothetical protein
MVVASNCSLQEQSTEEVLCGQLEAAGTLTGQSEVVQLLAASIPVAQSEEAGILAQPMVASSMF